MKTIKMSALVMVLLAGLTTVSFGQYGQGNQGGNGCRLQYPNGYTNGYNQNYPNGYNTGYNQNYPNGYGQNYPNGYGRYGNGQAYPNGGYNQYGQYPGQPQVVAVAPRVVVAPPIIFQSNPNYGYGYGYGHEHEREHEHEGDWGGRGGFGGHRW